LGALDGRGRRRRPLQHPGHLAVLVVHPTNAAIASAITILRDIAASEHHGTRGRSAQPLSTKTTLALRCAQRSLCPPHSALPCRCLAHGPSAPRPPVRGWVDSTATAESRNRGGAGCGRHRTTWAPRPNDGESGEEGGKRQGWRQEERVRETETTGTRPLGDGVSLLPRPHLLRLESGIFGACG